MVLVLQYTSGSNIRENSTRLPSHYWDILCTYSIPVCVFVLIKQKRKKTFITAVYVIKFAAWHKGTVNVTLRHLCRYVHTYIPATRSYPYENDVSIHRI